MEVSDASLGRLLLLTSGGGLLALAGWLNSYPFLDEESELFSYIWHPRGALLAAAAAGSAFVGGLMTFTLYHIYPYL